MDRPAIVAVIGNLIEECLEIPASEVTEASEIGVTLPIDSLDLLDVLLAAEERFAIEIPEAAYKDFRLVADLVTFIENARAAK